MAGYGGFQSLGEVARQFSQGFLQGRGVKRQEHEQDLQAQQRHIDNLSKLSEIHKNNPSMRETIDTQIEQAVQNLEASSNGQARKPPKEGSASSIFGGIRKLFSQNQPKTQTGTDWQSMMPEADKESTGVAPTPSGPPPAEAGSHTYGDLGDYFGQATRTPSQPQMETPATGSMPHIQTHPQMRQAMPEMPQPPTAENAQPQTQVATPKTDVQAYPMPATPNTPAGAQPQGPRAGGSPSGLPSPTQIRQQALTAESTPKYGYYDPSKVSMRANSQASDALDEALGMADALLDHHSDVKTFGAAVSHAEFGPEFKKLVDYAQRMEGSGLIEKGYVDNWLKTRFEDMRPGYQHPPAAIPKENMTLEQKVEHNVATPEEFDQYMSIIHQKASQQHINGPLTPLEQGYKNADDALAAKGIGPVERRAQLMRQDNAPQKPTRELKAIPNPRTGVNEWAWITEGTNVPEFTGQRSPEQFDIGRLKTSSTIMVPAAPGSSSLVAKTISDWNPVETSKALKNGQITSGDVQMILQGMQDPAAKATLQDFLDNPGKYQ